MADIGLTTALRITAAIVATLARVAVAVDWHLSHAPAYGSEITRAEEALAQRACRRRHTSLLRTSYCGGLVHALCRDPITRVVSAHLDLVAP